MFDTSQIDWSKVDDHTGVKKIDKVPGRVALIDADFLAYMATFDDETPWLNMVENADTIIRNLREASGAEHVNLFLTSSQSCKGNRYNIAIQKPYQGNRADRAKPKYLTRMREHLHTNRGASLAMDHEADDAIAAAAYADPANTVIISKDKDLLMIPGKQMHWDTGEFTDTGSDPWGWLELKQMSKSKKLVGRGWMFFFAQMLMGDTADNIQGLPKIDNGKGKLVACGPAKTYDIITNVSCVSGWTGHDMFEMVKGHYKRYGAELAFRYHGTDKLARWQDVFKSEAKLLWMRRNPTDENDVIDFFLRECFSPW